MTTGHGISAPLDDAIVHGVKNQPAIVLRFCNLLARSLEEHDARRHDVQQIQTAGRAALALLSNRDVSLFEESV